MTDSTRAPDYWALLEEITEYRGRLIRLANAVYNLIDADSRPAGEDWPLAVAAEARAAAAEACAAAEVHAADGEWLAPVIPLRAGDA